MKQPYTRQGNTPKLSRQQQARWGAPSPVDLKGTGWSPTRAQVPLCAAEVTQLDRVIVVPWNTDVSACQQWLRDHAIRAQSVMEVLENPPKQGERNRMVHAFVFKKRKHAALFKLAWGGGGASMA